MTKPIGKEKEDKRETVECRIAALLSKRFGPGWGYLGRFIGPVWLGLTAWGGLFRLMGRGRVGLSQPRGQNIRIYLA